MDGYEIAARVGDDLHDAYEQGYQDGYSACLKELKEKSAIETDKKIKDALEKTMSTALKDWAERGVLTVSSQEKPDSIPKTP